MNAMISVIMPAYNAEKTIELAIKSIINQTYGNFELIICDDGSNDNTVNIIKNIKDKRIRLIINDENIGNLQTTNKLFSLCTGKYIAIQDADDYSLKERFEKQIEVICKDNADLVGTQVGMWFENSIVSTTNHPEKNKDIMRIMYSSRTIPIIWGSVLFKKSIYESIGGFDGIFNRIGAADYNWLHRASFNSRFYNLQDTLYLYRQHIDSFTKKKNDFSIAKLYSEEIAFDIFEFFKNTRDYNFCNSSKIFIERVDFYSIQFSKDQKKLANIYYSNLIFKKINFYDYMKKIVRLKAPLIIKFRFFFQGLLINSLGMEKIQKIKKMMR
jgi:glycosyltransferase involved in cell wall biosynthesis